MGGWLNFGLLRFINLAQELNSDGISDIFENDDCLHIHAIWDVFYYGHECEIDFLKMRDFIVEVIVVIIWINIQYCIHGFALFFFPLKPSFKNLSFQSWRLVPSVPLRWEKRRKQECMICSSLWHPKHIIFFSCFSLSLLNFFSKLSMSWNIFERSMTSLETSWSSDWMMFLCEVYGWKCLTLFWVGKVTCFDST
jgi:hypothetical protein